MYISAAGTWVSNRDKLYSGHALRKQVPQVFDRIWCISPMFKPRIIETVASMYLSAAGKRVSGNSAGQNDNSQCICDKLHRGHALREQVPQVFDGIWCISPQFKPQIIKTWLICIYLRLANEFRAIRHEKTITVSASVTNCTVSMHWGSMYRKCLMVSGAYRQSSNLK